MARVPFPMPGHFIFKIMISSIRKVNRAIRYLKCQNPYVASFNRKMVFFVDCNFQPLSQNTVIASTDIDVPCRYILYTYEEMAWMDNE